MRDKNLDILRGLGMIFVVMGHCGFPFTSYLYTFHVPLFFILSGYLYTYNPKNKILSVIRKKIFRLYTPLVLMFIFLIITHNFFVQIDILCTDNSLGNLPKNGFIPVKGLYGFKDILIEITKAIFMIGGGQLSGALWFLRTMMFSSLLLEIQFRLIHRIKKNGNLSIYVTGINIILFIIGVILSRHKIHLPYSFELVATTMIFFSIGIHFKDFIQKIFSISQLFRMLIVINGFIIILIITPFDVVDISRNYFSNPMLMLAGASLGFLVIYLVSIGISNTKLANLIIYIGNNTVCIMCWHFLAFKIVNLILILKYNYPHIYLAKYPVIDGRYWMWYTIIGVGLPLILCYFYNKMRYKLWNAKNK